MRRRTQITGCGASRSNAELDDTAAEVGRLIAEAGAVLVCGRAERARSSPRSSQSSTR